MFNVQVILLLTHQIFQSIKIMCVAYHYWIIKMDPIFYIYQ